MEKPFDPVLMAAHQACRKLSSCTKEKRAVIVGAVAETWQDGLNECEHADRIIECTPWVTIDDSFMEMLVFFRYHLAQLNDELRILEENTCI